MLSNNDNKETQYPPEIPVDDKKELYHGSIVDVVKNEVEPKSATEPVKPRDTDSINTDFAVSFGDFFTTP